MLRRRFTCRRPDPLIYLAGQFKKPFIVIQLDNSDIPDEAEYFLTGFPRISATTLGASELQSKLALQPA